MSSAPGESQDKTLPQSAPPMVPQPINPADAMTLTPPSGMGASNAGNSPAPAVTLGATVVNSGTQDTLITAPAGTPGSQTSSKHSISAQDLSTDGLLNSAPRMVFEGRSFPSLGGIPLLAKLGQGGMGAVYFGIKPLLKQEVAVKVLPQQLAQQESGLVERFLREAQIAARVESPHLVRVTDVGEQGGLHYLVMEYVRGESGAGFIKRLLQAGQTGLDEATALDICIAATAGLAAAHQEGVIHRDVKPDNIMIPYRKGTSDAEFKNAKLADLGLARGDDLSQQSLTGANAAMGTPGYMSPEQALNARKAAKPADVFSMGATLYAFLSGRPPFRGETATETVVMTIQSPHKPLRELRPGVSGPTSDLVERCLSKDATQRFSDANALGEALMLCRASLGGSEATQADAMKTLALLQRVPEVGAAAQVLSTPTPGIPGSQATGGFPPSQLPQSGIAPASSGAWKPLLAVAALIVVIAGFFLFRSSGADKAYANAIMNGERALDQERWIEAERSFDEALKHRPSDGVAIKGKVDAQEGRAGRVRRGKNGGGGGGDKTDVTVLYSTEKESWVRWAAAEFGKTSEGKQIQLQLVPRHALDALDEILSGERKPQVWAPASNLYREMFKNQWKQKYGGNPILSESSLAASPLVMVMFEDRHKVFLEKYKEFNSRTFTDAMIAGTWTKLGGPADWGDVRFAVQHPLSHNSGMIWALLVTHRFYESSGISPERIRAPELKPWYNVLIKSSQLPGATSRGVADMFQKGTSVCDGLVAYESQVLEALSGNPSYSNVRVGYPKFNFWNEHPYYVLDAAWSTPAQRKAATDFQEFLLSDAAQKKLMEFGLRPSSTRVSLRGTETLWTRFEKLGITVEVKSAVADPNASVVRAMMDIFKDSVPEK